MAWQYRRNAYCWVLSLTAVSVLLLTCGCCCGPSHARVQPADATQIHILTTPGGTRFGLLGKRPPNPAPTLIVLSGTIERSLGDTYYLQSGLYLRRLGYLCVSIDLPCHGEDRRGDEPEGLAGWRYRLDRGEPFIASSNERLAQVIDYLIEEGYSDPQRIAACGISRGGFAALHYAAFDQRIKAVAAFAPVTDLGALREFETAGESPSVKALALDRQANALVGRPIWIAIGDRDRRVDTDAAIAFARHVSAVSYSRGVPSQLELRVVPEPRGHTVQLLLFERASQWIEKILQ